MKRILTYFFLVLFSLACEKTFAQVIDLSTGIVNGTTSTPIPTLSNDDTWTVCLPGFSYTNPFNYNPVPCGTGILDGVGYAYLGHDPSVAWLSPYLNPSTGDHLSSAPAGDYYYKTTFNVNCDLLSADLCFEHIGSDNYIDQIIINGNIHSVYYTFNPFSNNVCVLPAPSPSEFVIGSNELIMRSHNGGSWQGIEVKGSLTLTTVAPTPDASFCLTTPTASSVQATPSMTTGTQSWTVYSSTSGCPGSFGYIGTFDGADFNLSGAGPCYLIRHTVTNECGTACAAQSICHQDCDDHSCNLKAPINLRFDFWSSTMSWDPVPGAVSYVIVITPNDPACCRVSKGGLYAPVEIPVSGPEHHFDPAADLHMDGIRCYSWKVYAVCADGTHSPMSETFCSNTDRPVFGKKANSSDENGTVGANPATSESKGLINGDPMMDIFPNPAKGIVTFSIETAKEDELTIIVRDITGKTVKTFDKVKTTGKQSIVKWNTETLSKGTYTIDATTSDHKVISKKLIIE